MVITSTAPAEREWLLLLFFLSAKQAHARVQSWRRLQRIGAVSLKNSAYALPHTPESREDFEWIRNEIVTSGGQAMVLVARALEPAASDDIMSTFRAARAKDYDALAAEATQLLKRATRAGDRPGRELTQGLRRLRERFEETVRRDFFGAAEREHVEALLTTLDQRTGRTRSMPTSTHTRATAADYRGKVWLTRPRPGVDRMSSAWLIRRFIDPDARILFTDPKQTPDAIPFDTFEAEFGHHGTQCTFETLAARFGIDDPAVRHIGRIVHDLDLKETTHGEAETATIGRLVEGLRRAQPNDDALLQAGVNMFEALYQSLATTAGPRPSKSHQRLKRVARSRMR
jgi:hypothetical protein